MKADRLRECLEILCWSHYDLARALDCNPRLIRRWAVEGYAVPDSVGRWLEKLTTVHERHPPPTDWRVRRLQDHE